MTVPLLWREQLCRAKGRWQGVCGCGWVWLWGIGWLLRNKDHVPAISQLSLSSILCSRNELTATDNPWREAWLTASAHCTDTHSLICIGPWPSRTQFRLGDNARPLLTSFYLHSSLTANFSCWSIKGCINLNWYTCTFFLSDIWSASMLFPFLWSWNSHIF